MSIKTLDGVALIVKDLVAQRKFYQEILGFSVVEEAHDYVILKAGDRQLGLLAWGNHKEGEEALEGAKKGISHLEYGLTAEDRTELETKLKQCGAHAYGIMFKDPDGNLFHLNTLEGQ